MTKIISVVFSLFLLLGSMNLPAKAQVTCTMSGSSSQNGSCTNVSVSVTCSNGSSCAISYGGCDWGDVSVFYMTMIGDCTGV